MRTYRMFLALVTALALCAGCAVTTDPTDNNSNPAPSDVTLIGGDGSYGNLTIDPDAEPVPEGFARLTCVINWPPRPNEVSARRIFAYCETIEIEVTGSGIYTPVAASITRPATTASLVVPAGVNRTIAFEQLDEGAAHMATTSFLIAEIAGGVTYTLTFSLNDDFEPNQTSGAAFELMTDGRGYLAALDAPAGDIDDYYKFTVTGAPNVYLLTATDVISRGTHSTNVRMTMALLDTDGATELAAKTSYGTSNEDLAIAWEFAADGTYYVRLAETSDWDLVTQWEYVLAVNDDEGSGELDVTVD